MGVIDFNMLVEINEMLKREHIEYSLHSVGGCAICGVELRQDGQEYDTNKIVKMINAYLENKKLYIKSEEKNLFFNVYSVFAK